MEELLKDKVFWTKEKFKDKVEVVVENTESITSRPNTSNNDLKNDPGKTQVAEDKTEVLPEEVDAFKSIENKVIGLYFAANWCIPCQEFTTILKQTYDEIIERSSSFEVVFISFDKKLEDMKDFYNERHGHWLASPFKDPTIEQVLP